MSGEMSAGLQPLLPPQTGWRIGRRGDHHVDVVVGEHMTRIVLQPVDAPPRSYRYFWCYLGDQRDLRAVAAAHAFVHHATEHDEPVGFDRSWRAVATRR